MEIWLLILFLAGQKVEVPGGFETKEACIAAGEKQTENYKRYHVHSRAWFWCVEGRDHGS